MNFYRYPSAQSELVLASVWAKSAASEGHRRGVPATPMMVKNARRAADVNDRKRVILAMKTGRMFASEIGNHARLDCYAVARALAFMVEDGLAKTEIAIRPNKIAVKRRATMYSLVQS